mgnify:CR=1 FL=1
MQVQITVRAVRRLFVVAIGLLLAAHLSVVVGRLVLRMGPLLEWRLLLDFDEEHNLPTLYSSFALMVCAALLTSIGMRHRLQGDKFRCWLFLGAVFAFMATDEVVQFHERIDQLRGGALQRWRVSGWVLPYLAAAATLGLCLWRFLWDLPARHRNWFLLAGAIFVGGTVGFELLGPFAQRRGPAYYAVCYTCEELLEMTGVAVFALGLLDYAVRVFGGLSVSVVASTDAPLRSKPVRARAAPELAQSSCDA